MNEDYVPNIKKCRTCLYWKNGARTSTETDCGICHHLLYTGKRRKRDAKNNCLSYKKRCE